MAFLNVDFLHCRWVLVFLLIALIAFIIVLRLISIAVARGELAAAIAELAVTGAPASLLAIYTWNQNGKSNVHHVRAALDQLNHVSAARTPLPAILLRQFKNLLQTPGRARSKVPFGLANATGFAAASLTESLAVVNAVRCDEFCAGSLVAIGPVLRFELHFLGRVRFRETWRQATADQFERNRPRAASWHMVVPSIFQGLIKHSLDTPAAVAAAAGQIGQLRLVEVVAATYAGGLTWRCTRSFPSHSG